MSQFSAQEISQLWKRGYSMQKAWLAFAHPDLKTQWRAAHKSSAAQAFSDGAETAARTELSAVEKITMALSGTQKILKERGELEKQLKANILSYITKGHLIAFGFEAPRKVVSPAIEISPSFWNGKCDWANSGLEGQSLRFVEIRLLTPKWCREILERTTNTPNLDIRSSGRPSIKADVEAAFHTLNKQGKIDVSLSAKAHFDMVRTHMRNAEPGKYPETYQLGYEGIRRHFMPLFKELSKNSKQ